MELPPIFFSYSRTNIEYVDKLEDDFKKMGFPTWVDRRDIPFGSEWHKELSKAIQKSSAVVVVMTPESNASKWVHNEIHLALDFGKDIFPFLLAGKPFDIFAGTQYVTLSPENNFLPPIKFYQDLARNIDRKQQDIGVLKAKSTWASKPLPKTLTSPPSNNPKNTLINLSEWTDYARMGSKDYYGLTMLALAFEELGERKRAIYFLKKAHQLEPRIKDKTWMIYHHGWIESYHTLFDAIISDPEFWLPIRP